MEQKQQHIELNPEMFRAYDIRGIVGVDLDVEIAETIGKATGTYFIQRNDGTRIVVSMDNRLSSPELKAALIRGITSTGCDVTDIGMTTSPMMYFAVATGDYGGGVEVSASHNPKEYNGFKIVARAAYPVASDEVYKIRDIALSGKFAVGKGSVSQKDIEEEYINKIVSAVDVKRKLKVAIDTGNGIAGKFAPKLLRRLGCDVVELYTELDGNFPNHVPNPEHEANLTDLKKAVVAQHCDLGLGIDGDGDRTGLIDDQGKYLSSDYVIILLARDYLKRHPGETILVDVKSSQNVLDEIKAYGGTPFMYKTGHSLIKMKMRAENLHLGGEFSGHLYIFENYFPFDDALYASAKIISIVSGIDKPLSKMFEGLPVRYATSLLELGCPDNVKFDVMDRVAKYLEKNHEVRVIDGARVAYKNGWALLRASNTTPFLTFRAESDSKQGLINILKELDTDLTKFPEIDRTPLQNYVAKLEKE